MAILRTSPVVLDSLKDGKYELYDLISGDKTELNMKGHLNSLFFIDNKTILFPSGTMDIYSGKEQKLNVKIDRIMDYLPKPKIIRAETGMKTLHTYYNDYRGKIKYIICSGKVKPIVYRIDRERSKILLVDMNIDINIDPSYTIFTAEDKYIIAPNKNLEYQITNVETKEVTTFKFKFMNRCHIAPYLSGGLILVYGNMIKIWRFETMSFTKSYKLPYTSSPDLLVRNHEEFYMFYTASTNIVFYNSSTNETYIIRYEDGDVLSFALRDEMYEMDNDFTTHYFCLNFFYTGGDYITTQMIKIDTDQEPIFDSTVILLINFIEHTYIISEDLEPAKEVILVSNQMAIYKSDHPVTAVQNDYLIRMNTERYVELETNNLLTLFPYRINEQSQQMYDVSMKVLSKVNMISSNIKKVIAKFV